MRMVDKVQELADKLAARIKEQIELVQFSDADIPKHSFPN